MRLNFCQVRPSDSTMPSASLFNRLVVRLCRRTGTSSFHQYTHNHFRNKNIVFFNRNGFGSHSQLTFLRSARNFQTSNMNADGNSAETNTSLMKNTNPKIEKLTQESYSEAKYFMKALQANPTQEGFLDAIESFKANDKYRRKHLKFVRAAMEYMDLFQLQNNREVYNAIIDVFPRGRFNTRRFFDSIWAKPHPQVYLTLELLTKMEENGVIPNIDTYNLCEEVFGKGSLPTRKCFRLAYWMLLFENVNPYRLPEEVYKEKINVCKAAVERIFLGAKDVITTYHLKDDEETGEKEFTVGSIMKNQQNILQDITSDVTLYVEGPISMWVNRSQQHYYVLRTDREHSLQAPDDFNKYYWQDYGEGIVIAMCMTNRKIPDALLDWISELEKELVQLRDFRIVFNVSRNDTIEEIPEDARILEPRRAIASSTE